MNRFSFALIALAMVLALAFVHPALDAKPPNIPLAVHRGHRAAGRALRCLCAQLPISPA